MQSKSAEARRKLIEADDRRRDRLKRSVVERGKARGRPPNLPKPQRTVREDHKEAWIDAQILWWPCVTRHKGIVSFGGKKTTIFNYIDGWVLFERTNLRPKAGQVYSSSKVSQCSDCSRWCSSTKLRLPIYRWDYYRWDYKKDPDHYTDETKATPRTGKLLCPSCWMKDCNIEKRSRACYEIGQQIRRLKNEIREQNRNRRSASPVLGNNNARPEGGHC